MVKRSSVDFEGVKPRYRVSAPHRGWWNLLGLPQPGGP